MSKSSYGCFCAGPPADLWEEELAGKPTGWLEDRLRGMALSWEKSEGGFSAYVGLAGSGCEVRVLRSSRVCSAGIGHVAYRLELVDEGLGPFVLVESMDDPGSALERLWEVARDSEARDAVYVGSEAIKRLVGLVEEEEETRRVGER